MIDWTSRYCASLTELDRYRDLVHSVVALGAHRRPDLDPASTQGRLESLAHRIRSRVPHLSGRVNIEEGVRSVDGLLAHLDEAMFVDLGLGVEEAVLHPDAMDLDLVLSGVPGLPITGALAYCAVAERIGLDVFGIDMPGTFLVGVRDRSNRRLTVLDAGSGGRQIDGDEFRKLVHDVDPTADPRTFLIPASPAIWLRRWLQDLALTSGRSGEVHLLDSWSRLSTVTEDILGTD